MKSSELHRLIRRAGWTVLRVSGSHIVYVKAGRVYPVPFHGAKEIGEGLRKKIVREMGLQKK